MKMPSPASVPIQAARVNESMSAIIAVATSSRTRCIVTPAMGAAEPTARSPTPMRKALCE